MTEIPTEHLQLQKIRASLEKLEKALESIATDALRVISTTQIGLSWADGAWGAAGNYELIPAPGAGKAIAIYFFRRGNIGEGENGIAFRWGQTGNLFFRGRMWYCGVELATLLIPRTGPENTALWVSLDNGTAAQPRTIDFAVAYKIVNV